MDIKSIRQKYKMIINCQEQPNNQENQQQESEREWIKIVKNQEKKRVLTEHNSANQNCMKNNKQPSKKSQSINKKNSSFNSYQSNILNLKEKFAQALHDLKKKDQENAQLQNTIIRKNQQIKHLNQTLNSIKKQVQIKEDLITEQKIKVSLSQKTNQEKDKQIKAYQLDNELLQAQIQHYRKQIQQINYKFNEKEKQYQNYNIELKKTNTLKNKIQRLKDDVKRLQFLLSDNQIYAPLFIELEGKHFLGKPTKQGKQLQYWYPESLIQCVQKFLKKQRYGAGNKIFSQELVKFIYTIVNRNQKQCQKKCKNIYHSRIKQIQRKKNQIMNIFEVTNIQPKKFSAYNSRLCTSQLKNSTPLSNNTGRKSKGYSVCLNKKSPSGRSVVSQIKNSYSTVLPAQNKKSFLIQGLEKSIKFNAQKNKQIIIELIDSFCQGLYKILSNQIQRQTSQKLKKLINWLKQSIQQVFENNKKSSLNKSKCAKVQKLYNSTGKWKTISDI